MCRGDTGQINAGTYESTYLKTANVGYILVAFALPCKHIDGWKEVEITKNKWSMQMVAFNILEGTL